MHVIMILTCYDQVMKDLKSLRRFFTRDTQVSICIAFTMPFIPTCIYIHLHACMYVYMYIITMMLMHCCIHNVPCVCVCVLQYSLTRSRYRDNVIMKSGKTW